MDSKKYFILQMVENGKQSPSNPVVVSASSLLDYLDKNLLFNSSCLVRCIDVLKDASEILQESPESHE